jgi:putative DNA primase/helicase
MKNTDAERFLRALAPNGSLLTFQTFDDNKNRKNNSLAKVLHGPLKTHAATLAKLQKQGAGVFITVNETDGKGRSTAHG